MLTILGATGYTGRLCAQEAARLGLPFRVAGRRRDALDALAGELGPPARRPEVAVADVADQGALARLAESSDVLLSTVGPYTSLGRPVVEAALAGGCDYLDVTGETPFLSWAYDQHDSARDAGVALCPAMGFDGMPGDLMAALCAGRLEGGVDSVRVAYLVRGGRPSRGTALTALGVAAAGGAAHRGGEVAAEAPLAHGWKVPFPPPLGERSAVSIPMPEVVTVGSWAGADEVRTFGVAPAAPVLRAVAGPVSAGLRALSSTPAWGLLERGAGLLPEGPSPQRRSAARTAVLTEVCGPGGVVRSWARFTDVYATTARSAVGLARRLLDGPPATGVLAPSRAVDQGWQEFLEEVGGRFDWLP